MNTESPYILVVDDERDIRQLVSEILEDEGYQVAMAENAASARIAIAQRKPQLILLDIWMPDTDGITLLKELADSVGPVIMMSGHGSVESAVEATRLGAYDFLEKPLSLAKLLLTVERALETGQLQQENTGLKQQLMLELEPIGSSAIIEQTKNQLKRLSQHNTKVLLVGEAGVGKELFARYLHKNTHRREGPFIAVAVGSIAPENSAVEFFGKENQGKVYQGLLEQAQGGTLFLGEITDMDAETQTRFLSALESSSFLRVGGSESVRTDIRVIASTRASLPAEISAGRFRQDLYYLLNETMLEIAPLRARGEDVPSLLNFYIEHFINTEKLPFRRFSIAAQNYLRSYPWPGNVRELRNLVQRLLILGAGNDIELDETKKALGLNTDKPLPGTLLPEFFNFPLKEAREQFEKSYLEYHFEKTGSNVAKLAAISGIERTHLYRKLHALKIKL